MGFFLLGLGALGLLLILASFTASADTARLARQLKTFGGIGLLLAAAGLLNGHNASPDALPAMLVLLTVEPCTIAPHSNRLLGDAGGGGVLGGNGGGVGGGGRGFSPGG